MSDSSNTASAGIGFGCAMAMIISYSLNHSIGWMIWHGILGWVYVIYRWIVGY